jgi:hypothetical protein
MMAKPGRKHQAGNGRVEMEDGINWINNGCFGYPETGKIQ